MRKWLVIPTLLGGLLLGSQGAEAHCDSLAGPVAAAAVKALETGNVNLVLPYAPASAEDEMAAAFAQAVAVRATGGEAEVLADRYFIETAVRLHRAGEGAPYTGLKPAETDFGPAIPAAERALESGDHKALEALMVEEVRRAIRERLAQAKTAQLASKAPETRAGVSAARERVSAELGFIGFVERLYLAAKGGEHPAE